ncbi:FG-GAP-like repeat-containing protein [Chitinophaga qingshengii]|uniref:VCBS repeat-containing protein n=1 Tax=Chitinophaga qingshengii TaxID=1569794 RepID=A0ABR7TF82_9BACT|nr:SpvB/TcaC N-terminal domain-containing protein [Chitinophaga qingshengii]MBC9928986.1 VCBS repeat-containing protein [Chitinophaga qingshengii]
MAHAQIDVSKPVGGTTAFLDQTATGGAAYTVPIQLPPGTNNVEPQLNLSYNSHAGNGIAGVGWNIGGLPSIARAGRNNYYNGITYPVSYENSTDAFVMDGMRMFAITGSNGANGTVYGFENENYAKIESFGGTEYTGPTWFKVTSKDGTVMEFGNSNDSRLMTETATTGGSPATMVWYLNKLTDRNGNYILFNYTTVNYSRTVVINEINYTGNAAGGQLPYNKIKFNYDSRPDVTTTYEAGFSSVLGALLSSIVITTSGQTFKTYQLAYNNVQSQPFLQTITETGTNGVALNPLRFSYGNNANAEDVRILPPYPFLPSQDCIAGDFDGDGQTDVLTASYNYDNNGFKYHTKYQIFRNFDAFGSVGMVSSLYSYPSLPSNVEVMGVKENSYYNFLAQDYDGDGKDDVVFMQTGQTGSGSGARRYLQQITINHTRIYTPSAGWGYLSKVYNQLPQKSLYVNPCKYISQSGRFFIPGDFDGDGSQDYLLILGINPDNSFGAFLSSPGKQVLNREIANFGVGTNTFGDFYATSIATADDIIPFDVDGDGKTELLVIKGSTSYVVSIFPVSVTSGYSYAAKVLFTTNEITSGYRVFPGDFNGDGKTDLFVRNTKNNSNGTWKMLISKGNSLVSATIPLLVNRIILPGDDVYPVAHQLVVGDFNQDGKSDLLHCLDLSSSSARYNVYYSTGNGFVAETYAKNGSINGDNAISGDLNGDGKMDCVSLKGQTGLIVSLKPDKEERLLSKVVNGFGAVNTITYAPLSKSGTYVYSRSTEYEYGNPSEINGGPSYLYAYPYQVIQPSLNVVSSIGSPDGIGGTVYNRYTYQDAMFHKTGRGFLGFRKVTVDNGSNYSTTTTLSDINTQFLAPYVTKKTVSVGGNVSETRPTYSFVQVGLGYFDKRFEQRLSNLLDIDYLTNAGVQTINTYDNVGNITKSEIIKGGWNGSSITATETNTQDITYGNYGSPVASSPESITITNIRQGVPAVTKKIAYTYKPNGLTATKTEFDGKPKAVTTTLTYDAFGNVTSSVLSSAGLTSRSETLVYDPAGRFMLKRTGAGGGISRSETYTYDPLWGKMASYLSADGKYITYEYDAFGRIVKTTVPDGFSITQSLSWESSGGVYAGSTSQPGGGNDVKIWYDILGREVKRQTSGFGNATMLQTTTYDAKGNVNNKTAPYYASEMPSTTSYTYDSYNRLSTRTDGYGISNYSYQAMPGGLLKASITNPAGQVTSRTTDPTGKIVAATDNGGQLDFSYDSWGNQLKVNHGSFELIKNQYDEYGRQTQMTDKDAGTAIYDYDAFGQLTSQKDNLGNTYALTLDGLGRVIKRQGPDGITSYTYFSDPANGYNNDNLASETGPNGVVKEYEYNNKRKLSKVKQKVDGQEFVFQYEYDTYGNLSKTTYPSGLVINQTYDRNGAVTAISTGSGLGLFTATSMNSLGYYTGYTTGNGKTSIATFDLPTGRPKRFYTPGIQDLNFTYESTSGNMTSRYDAIQGHTEVFTYDNLNRLASTKLDGTVTQNITYDNTGGVSLGNITTKTDAGNYVYNDQLIHAVNYITNPAGATTPPPVIPSAQQDITYTPFLKTATIKENNYQLAYTYTPAGQRIKSELSQNGTFLERKFYLGTYEKYVAANGTVREVHYVAGGNGLCALIVKTNGVEKTYYVYVDHLGSLLSITDENGAIVAQQNFDAWGRSRNPSTWTYSGVTPNPEWLSRGFTGHEHLDKFSLINMNGRVYDPVLGRMLSPDNYVPLPYGTQGYNRYGYANNNPMIYSDEDGNFWHLIIGALIGGAMNLFANKDKINNFWDGLKYFGIGAAAGAIGAGVGAGVSSALAGGSFGAGFMGTSAAMSVTSSFINGAIVGAAGGAAGGFVGGFGNGLADGQNLGQAFGSGLKGGLYGGLIGGVTGGLAGGIDAAIHGRRFFDGATVTKVVEADQAIPVIGQKGDNNCLPASAESVDKSLGGNMTQERIREVVAPGTDPKTVPLGDRDVWSGYANEAGRQVQGQNAANVNFCEIADKMNAGNRVAVGINPTGGQTVGHSVVIKSVISKTITKIGGKQIYQSILKIMDPGHGGSFSLIKTTGWHTMPAGKFGNIFFLK